MTPLQSTEQITRMNILVLKESHPTAFHDLVEKCKNPNHTFTRNSESDSSIILRERCLINNKDQIISEEVRRIILNFLEATGAALKSVNPVNPNQL